MPRAGPATCHRIRGDCSGSDRSSIWLGWAEWGGGEEGAGCTASASDPCCSYQGLVDFLKQIIFHLLYMVRTIPETLNGWASIYCFHQLWVFAGEEICGAPHTVIPRVKLQKTSL